MRLRRTRERVVAAAVCLSLSTVLPAGPAVGEPEPAVPSRQDVDRARAAAADRARDVGAIEARMLLANQRLEEAAVRAEQASEAYNGALWRLRQAVAAHRASRVAADRAHRRVGTQRTRIGALVAHSYQQGGDVSTLHAMLGGQGIDGVLDQYAGFQGASTSLQADYRRFAAAQSLAEVFERQAETARSEQVTLAAAARSARGRASSAAAAARSEAFGIAVHKARLVRELARAQNVSVTLARTRQDALERAARARAQAQVRARALAAEAAADRAQDAEATQPQPEAEPRPAPSTPLASAAPSASTARPTPTPQPTSTAQPVEPAPVSPSLTPAPEPEPNPAPARAPEPVATVAAAPSPSEPPPAVAPAIGSGGQQAIRHAREQLGEPYQWGAAGPGSWDCSGLTMMAWASAGVSLPHYSVAQYDTTTPISVADLQPGDLVFWSSTGSPSGIHHVALYLGGGQIIHAPRTGRPVEVDDMYYWIPPTFFGRVRS